jgi:hypothetical protein
MLGFTCQDVQGILIVDARASYGNPYDGHALNEQLEQVMILMQDSAAKQATELVDLDRWGVDADLPSLYILRLG